MIIKGPNDEWEEIKKAAAEDPKSKEADKVRHHQLINRLFQRDNQDPELFGADLDPRLTLRQAERILRISRDLAEFERKREPK